MARRQRAAAHHLCSSRTTALVACPRWALPTHKAGTTDCPIPFLHSVDGGRQGKARQGKGSRLPLPLLWSAPLSNRRSPFACPCCQTILQLLGSIGRLWIGCCSAVGWNLIIREAAWNQGRFRLGTTLPSTSADASEIGAILGAEALKEKKKRGESEGLVEELLPRLTHHHDHHHLHLKSVNHTNKSRHLSGSLSSVISPQALEPCHPARSCGVGFRTRTTNLEG